MAEAGALPVIGSEFVSGNATPTPGRSWRTTALIFFCSFALIFGSCSAGRKINVDENVFITSAALLVRQNALIYRDFHYNHMPTLVLIYAALFRMTGYYVLVARTFSALCAAGSAAIFFHVAYKSFDYLTQRRRMTFALIFGLLYLTNPLVTHTAGRAWNHDFPALMSLLGFLVMSGGLKRKNSWLLLGSGVLVGLAFTSRLTFATELLPFSLFVLIYPNHSLARRIGYLSLFAAGALVASIPSIWVWAQSPVNAYFGNFQYPAFNTLWHNLHDDDPHHRNSVIAKIWFFLFNTCIEMPGNGVVFVGFVVLIAKALDWRMAFKSHVQCELLILVLLAASQIAAGVVPSPPFFQYFYAATPFLLLGVILALAQLPQLATNDSRNWIWYSCLGLTLAFGIPQYHYVYYLFWPPAWIPVQAHRAGELIAAASTGPVLTLDPIYIVEGGLVVYPELGTGVFGMRVGDYLTPAQQAQYKMWGSDDVRHLFDTDPPPAVMISPGSDAYLEPLFTQLAQSHGYTRLDLRKKSPAVILWVRPAPKIESGASTKAP